MINESHDTVYYDIAGWGLDHQIKGNPEISLSGRVSFGISAFDLMNDVPNKNGVFDTKFYYDTALIFNLNMSEISFNTSRYINSLIDYPYFIKSQNRVLRTEVDTNNMLRNYTSIQNNGIIDFNDSLVHNILFEVKDIYGNISKLAFKVSGKLFSGQPDSVNNIVSTSKPYFNFAKKNNIIKDKIKVNFPANSFYKSFYFDFEELEKDSSSFSSTYKLHNRFTPVHKYFTVSILPDSSDPKLNNKRYISYSSDNVEFFYVDTKTDGNYLVGRSRALGYYKVLVDSIPPVITEVNFKNDMKITKQNKLKIKIKDAETGINTYAASLNNCWILMEYDPKKDLLVYNFDKMLKKGRNEFKLIITDMLDNTTEYKCELNY